MIHSAASRPFHDFDSIKAHDVILDCNGVKRCVAGGEAWVEPEKCVLCGNSVGYTQDAVICEPRPFSVCFVGNGFLCGGCRRAA